MPRTSRIPLGVVFCLLAATGRGADPAAIDVAAYYFPNWGPVATSVWGLVRAAKPQLEGHLQPKVPTWGYENENDPAVMARKIEAAKAHGINAFIFDWYFFDPQPEPSPQHDRVHWDGQNISARP